MPDPVMLVHGGAWSLPDDKCEMSRKGVEAAVQAGYKVLREGGTSVDAVEAAIKSLEDDPVFDAGKGSVLSVDGEVFMDALLMRGSDQKAGAVVALENVSNPISVARRVMEKSNHVMLGCTGSTEFAHSQGFPFVETELLHTADGVEELSKHSQFTRSVSQLFCSNDAEIGHDTVGAVALDMSGAIAAGTSTGGITAKLPGRVGDVPFVGCGAYCDDDVGGVSVTGHGEAMTKTCLSFDIMRKIKGGTTGQDAVTTSLQKMAGRVGGYGGAITVTKNGDIGVGFTTKRMSWAAVKDGDMISGTDREHSDITRLRIALPPPNRPIPGLTSSQPCLIIHGGLTSSTTTIEEKLEMTEVIRKAALYGYTLLKSGEKALDAVVGAVKQVEQVQKSFAHNGLHQNGTVNQEHNAVSKEAFVMEGERLNTGGVSLVSDVRHPADIARAIMDKTPHTFLVGKGAEEFGRAQDKSSANGIKSPDDIELPEQMVPTIGAIAIDSFGNVACSNTTCGSKTNGWVPGQMSSAALSGSGGYADNESGVCVVTGPSDYIMRTCAAKETVSQMADGQHPQAACYNVLQTMTDRAEQEATSAANFGLVAINTGGESSCVFTGEMPWACANGSKVIFGYQPDKVETVYQ